MEWDYGVALEPAAAAHATPYSPFLDGGYVDGSGEPLTTLNPTTAEILAEGRGAGATEVDRAVAAARRAAADWSALPGAERARVLFRVAHAVAARRHELAVLETLDTGRPVRGTRDVDLPEVAAHLHSCAGWADKLGHAGHGPDPRPVGVVGALVGAGSLRASVRRIGAALACGNAVVLGPDPDAPLTALVLAAVATEAGLPAGVLNVLPGVGPALAGHTGLDAVAVTGSAADRRDAARHRAGRGRFTAESGGRAVHVVHDDAPLDQAVDGVVEGLGGDQRVLVAEAVADEFGELLRERVARLRVGDPLDRNTDLGPVGTRERWERATALAAGGAEEGARGWTSPAPTPGRGLFLAPTVFTDVAPSMRLARDPIVGPLLPVLTFRTPVEAVALAKGARRAAVWADKGSRALWTAQNLRAGVVWVNAFGRSDPAVPAHALADLLAR